MLMLDTDHMSELGRRSAKVDALVTRLSQSGKAIVTSIPTVEELYRGRLAQIAQAKEPSVLLTAYGRFHDAVEDMKEWDILPFDERAARILDRLRAQRLGIGTLDLRIASIAMANGARLLSRNLRDFQRVPGLAVEDWLT